MCGYKAQAPLRNHRSFGDDYPSSSDYSWHARSMCIATTGATTAIVAVSRATIRSKNFPIKWHITKTTKIIKPRVINVQHTWSNRNNQ
mmetsp:Transcript_4398/g.9987  ORF Transcript_4398/g.9987 Transcript_4398/m.9987 type:complete len:88 (+) Transcript_4398:165-428(+)